MTRLEYWELALHEFVESRVGQPFVWGGNDCALFVCDGVLAMTGTDIATDFRGKYSDQAGAGAAMQSVTGGSTIEEVAVYVTARAGMIERASPRLAQRGDVVLFDGQEGTALGLVYLDGVHAAFVGPAGLRKLPVLDCRRAWKVG